VRVRELAVSGAVSAATTAAWWLVLPHARGIAGDPAYYVAMAENPGVPGHTPYAFRILAPWLAHALGGAQHSRLAFHLISLCALAATGPAVYLICRRLGGGPAAALTAMVALLSTPGWLFNVFQPYLIDPVAMLLEGWLVAALVVGWLEALPLLVILAAFARETYIGYALPVYAWLSRRLVDLRAARTVLFAFGPALVAVWVMRRLLVAGGWQTTSELVTAGYRIVRSQRHLGNTPWWVAYAFVGSLGIWWLFAVYAPRRGGRLWWLLVPVFAQFLVGGDWSRFAMYAFPVVMPVGVLAVWAHPRRGLLLGIAALQSAFVFIDVLRLHKLVLDQPYPSMYPTLALFAVGAVALWWPYRRPERAARADVAAGEAAEPVPSVLLP
jgi:hypothetical protein